MGLYDDKANIKLVKEMNGGKDVIYLGWSQGTSQLLYALWKEKETGGTFFADNLSKAVLFTPCTILEGLDAEYYSTDGSFKYWELGVNSINGPGWENNATMLCEELSA